MKIQKLSRFAGLSIVLAALVALVAAGCQRSSSEPPAPEPIAKQDVPKGAPAAPKAANGAGLGTAQQGKTFGFELNAASLKTGSIKFTGHVHKNGKPVDNATVRIVTKMPTMKMDGPSFELKQEKTTYSGVADFPMGGDYEAVAEVTLAGDRDTFTYTFQVSQ